MKFIFKSRDKKNYLKDPFYQFLIFSLFCNIILAVLELFILIMVLFLVVVIFSIFYWCKMRKETFFPLIFDEFTIAIYIEDGTCEKIQYKEIHNITLKFIGVKGDVSFPKGGQINGKDNVVIIETENEKIEKNIICENDQDYMRLKLLVKFLKNKGININARGFGR